MKSFTLLAGAKKNKATVINQRFTRLLATALLAISVFVNGSAVAQTITFTGATTDFTGPGISALAAGTGAVTYYASTDGTFMYLGAFRTGGSTWGTNDHFTFYVDADPRNTVNSGNGSLVGLAWDNQTPTMPTRADYRVAIRTDGNTGSGQGSSFYSTNVTTSGAANWSTGGANARGYTQFVSNASNGGMEIRVPLSDFGNPASVYLSIFASFSGGGGGFFGSATGTFTGNTLSGYLRNLGVYRSTGNLTAGTVTTPITDLTIVSNTTTSGDYGDISVTGASIIWTLGGSSSFTGSMTVGASNTSRVNLVSNANTLFVGGRGSGGTAGQIAINSTSGNPIYSGTSSGGGLTFLGAGLVNGSGTRMIGNTGNTVNVAIGGSVDFTGGSGTTTLFNGGGLQINSGGSMSNPLTFQAGYTLTYNTGGTYSANNEWATNATTLIPTTVTIQGNTAVNFGSSNAYRQANGLVTVGSGSSLTMSSVSGGDLRIAAGLTNNNAGTGVGINTNGRALLVQGAGTYTKTGTDNLDFLLFGAANQLTLASGTNLSLTNTNATGCLQFNAAGTLFMGGTNTVSIVAGGTIGGSSAGSIGGTSPTTSILSLLGTTTWSPGGVVTVSTAVGIQVNAGLTITTAGRLSAGYLQINPGGFIGGSNPVVYPASSTLVYNHNTGTYGVQTLEWPSTTGPVNVTVNANGASTGISFGTNNITARTLTGTLTINQNVNLSGSGPAAITTLNLIANATAAVTGSGNYTQTASGSFTTANTTGINGTLTTSGTKTLPASTSFTFNNATTSQTTGALLPATIAALTINNPTAATGTTISNNTLVISGTTTLTAGALILPTAGGNLVTFSGNISTPTGGGTITGSTSSNITTNASSPGISGTGTGIVFTSGGQNLGNWTCTTVFGSSTPTGLNSPLTINGTFTFPSSTPDLYTTASGAITFASGSTFTQNGTSGSRILGAGSCTVGSGSTMIIGSTTGLASTGANGAIQPTTRTFSGGANYTFNNSTTAQAIGDALDVTVAAGKTGAITGNISIQNNTGTGVTLNAGTTITINTPGNFTVGVAATSSAILSAPATSVINGTGTFSLLGNGATNGSTLNTANATGVNGTVAVSGTISLNNAGNNNTNFGFNGSVAQTTGALLPATVNNLNFLNTFSGSVASPSVTLSSSVTTTGTITFAGGAAPLGLVGIGAGNTLTVNGILTNTNANKLVGTTTSNFIIGGSGTISATGTFAASGGGTLNNFTLNRSGSTFYGGTTLVIGGTFALTNGLLNQSAGVTLNGPISLGASGQLRHTGGSITVSGSGAITGTLTTSATPLTLTSLTMDRSGQTLTIGSGTDVTISGGTTPLTLSGGTVDIASSNMTLTSTNNITTTPTGGGMIRATGTGQFFKTLATGASSFNFPIGDGTNYSPVALTFTANAVAGTIGARVTATAHPQYDNSGAQTDYLTRFWSFTTTGLTTYTYTSAFTYVAGDINGTEGNIKLNRWNGSIWAEDATSTAASNVLTSTTGITNVTFPLNANAYTGRKEITAITYVWNGSTSNDWATAANWTPSGIPGALDNVTINVTGSFTNASINSGSKTVNNFILNGTGAFAMATGTTLIVNGTITYGGTATASLDCASTVNIASAAAQTIPALNFGNLDLTGGNRTLSSTGTIGICGTYTPGAGTITTTSSTVNFNGSGAQTIPATNFNNLTSSSSGARTLANSGTVTVAGTFTPGSNTFTVTGSTVALTSTTGFAFANLPVVVSGNSFNTLTINGTGGIFALPYSATTQNVATTLNVTAGTFVINPSSSSLVNTISVGTININGGTLDDRSTGSGTTTNLQVTTAWNQTSGVVTNTGSGEGKIVFTGGGATTFTGLTAAASFQFFGVQVANNTTTTLASALTVNNVSGNSFSVDAGSTMVGGTFLVSTNAAGNSFIINGTYRTAVLAGFSGTATSALSSTNSPTVTLGSASTIEYTSAGTSPVITGRSDYANVIVSGSSSTFTFNGTSTLSGNYNQSAGTVRLTLTATANNLNVAGNFDMTGGTFNLVAIATATASTTVTVTGNTTTSGSSSINLESVSNANAGGIGIFQTTDFTTTSTSTSIVNLGSGTFTGNEFRISGNLNKSGAGTFDIASSTNLIGGIVFNKAGTQTFTYAGAASIYANYIVNSGSTLQMLTGVALGTAANPYAFFTVNNGATIDMGTNVISGGSATVIAANTGFTLASGATMITANTGGVASSITNLTKNFTAGASYEFNSAVANQSFGFTGLTIGNPTNITVSNTFGTVTPDANIILGNTASLNVNTGAILVAAARTFTFGTGGNVNVTGTLQTANVTATGALSGSATSTIVSTNTPTITLNSGSTIVYNGAAAQFASARTFAGLTINNASGLTMLGNITTTALGLTAGNVTIGTNTLTINGATSRTSGNLLGSNTSNVTIGGTAQGQNLFFATGSTNNYLKNLTLNTGATATLGNALNITDLGGGSEGSVTVSGTGTLTTGGFLTLKSTASGTARVAQGRTTGGYISGNVIAERFIPQNTYKAWRLLTAPTSGQTINAAWQEGQADSTTNPNPGYGTMIASSGANYAAVQALGFDNRTGGASILYYQPATDNLIALPNTNSTPISTYPGYFIFIRGDRSAGQFYGPANNAPATTSTTLRSTGSLYTGDQTGIADVVAGQYGLVGNPFASRIDMRNISLGGGMVDAFELWDPKLIGSYGFGAYQTFTKSGADYLVTPGDGSYGISGSVHNFIESGSAFFMQATGTDGTIDINETAKISGSSVVNRPSGVLDEPVRFITNLYVTNTGITHLADGNMIMLDAANTNSIDINDVKKSPNFGENLGLRTANTDLVVERRALPTAADTFFYKIGGLKQLPYKLEFIPAGLGADGLAAYLEDKYLGTSTMVSLLTTFTHDFTVDANAASKAADRFRIVFRPLVIVPVTFTAIRAQQVNNNIAVEWKVTNQVNIASYDIMKSTDGRNFTNVGTQVASNTNSNEVSYNWLDENAVTGANYYRVKSVDRAGASKYTEIVKVVLGKGGAVITVLPNPVRGNAMNLQFVNQAAGKYSIRLTNTAGQVLYISQVQHNGGSTSQNFVLPSAIISGVYQLEVMSPDNTKQVQKLIINSAN